MRKILTFVLLAGVAITACNKYDDSELRSKINDHEKRIVSLEDQCARMNTNITSINTLLAALQDNDFVKSVVPVNKDGATIGYTITFSKSDPITIYHGTNGQAGEPGATPQIGVKKHTDGKYYWTLNGEWIVDSNSNKIPATGENGQNGNPGERGITPNLKIEDDFWWVSYDNGSTWSKLSKATGADGDSMFESVVVDEENNKVTFNLADGNSVTLPFGRAELIRFAEEGDWFTSKYIENNNYYYVDVNILTNSTDIKQIITGYQPISTSDIITKAEMNDYWYSNELIQVGDLIRIRPRNVNIYFPNAILTVTAITRSGESQSISKFVHNDNALNWKGESCCYIIPLEGNNYDDFNIPTKLSNYVFNQAETAEVLWQSFPNSQEVICDVEYIKEGDSIYMYYDNPDRVPGNAVIALRDASNQIIFSWHIWVTETPENQIYKDGKIVMDRNLGAVSATPGNPGSLGLMYQWGNKNPFLGASSISANTKVASTNPDVWTVGTNGSEYSQPTAFNKSRNYSYVRHWRYDKPKQKVYDPCPAGYRVMSPRDFGDESKVAFDKVNKGIYIEDHWYPAAGYLNGNGDLVGVGQYCTICVAGGDEGFPFVHWFKDSGDYAELQSLNSLPFAFAGSVRCMKE